jgi:amidase
MTRFDSALSLADAIRSRQVSPVEALDHYLARVDLLDPHLNAFCWRDDERARAEARRAEDAVMSTPAEDLPPFCGVPVPIKDLVDVAGWPTSHGSRAVDDEPAAEDAPEVERLRRAGFVIMGKTTTPELGTIAMTESMRFGPTRNPWDPSRTPGGSSGGAAAAVASGMAPLAHASDGGGSIRIPASCTGLVGLKPGRNRVTSTVEKLTAAATSGVVSRTVADTAAALDILAAFDPGAWNVAPPPPRPFTAALGDPPPRLRIRVVTDNLLGVPVDPSCVDAVERAAARLSDAGHDVDGSGIDWPDPGGFLTGFLTVWSTISAGTVLSDPERLEPHNAANRSQALATDAIAYVESVALLQRTSRPFVTRFGRDFDLLLTPTMAVTPPEVGSVWAGVEDDPLAPITNCTPMACFTAVFNVTGLPALSLPVGEDPGGVPVGVQLAGPPWREDLLLGVGAQLETAFGWPQRWPELAARSGG